MPNVDNFFEDAHLWGQDTSEQLDTEEKINQADRKLEADRLEQAEMYHRMAELDRRFREFGTERHKMEMEAKINSLDRLINTTASYNDMSVFLEKAVLALALKTGEYDYIAEVFGKIHSESKIKSSFVREWLEENLPELIGDKDGKG